MPRIQPNTIFNHLESELVAHMPFVNDTSILYVLDMPRMTVSITTEQMLKWGLEIDDLDRIARVNLAAYHSNLKLQIVEADDGGRAAIFNVQDVILIINIILNDGDNYLADINNDTTVNVLDVIQLINIILN
mgnify:CR=1 FL=1